MCCFVPHKHTVYAQRYDGRAGCLVSLRTQKTESCQYFVVTGRTAGCRITTCGATSDDKFDTMTNWSGFSIESSWPDFFFILLLLHGHFSSYSTRKAPRIYTGGRQLPTATITISQHGGR